MPRKHNWLNNIHVLLSPLLSLMHNDTLKTIVFPRINMAFTGCKQGIYK